MDPSALENVSRSLESSLDFWGVLLITATFLVVIGLVLEYRHDVAEFIEQARRPAAVFPWRRLWELVGAILVTVGVAGELFFTYKASGVESRLRDNNHKIEALLTKEAGDAKTSADGAAAAASRAVSSAEHLGIALQKSTAAAEAAQGRLRNEQRATAHAQKEAADAQLALRKYVDAVARRQTPRHLDRGKLVKLLEGKPRSRVELLYNPNDLEAWWFADEICLFLGKGNGNEPGAGWDVSQPKPIPTEAGGRELNIPGAPPAARFGGATSTFGITFRAKEITFPTKPPALGALANALFPSILPFERGYSFEMEQDAALPDDLIVIIVGPKPPIWWMLPQ